MEKFCENRRSDRVDLAIPVQVIGSNSLGLQVFKTGVASVLNKNGATIQVDCVFVPDQVVTIRNLANSKECEGRIVGLIQKRENLFVYGVTFLDPSINLWDLHFPELPLDPNP